MNGSLLELGVGKFRACSTSSSKVSTSGDLRFERKLSKLRNFESIRLPSARHKSHMGRSPETSVARPNMDRRQCCLPRCRSRQSIRQGSPWRPEPSSNPEVSPLQTGIEARLRVRSISLLEPSWFTTTTSSSFGRSGLFFAPENGPRQLRQARAQLGSRADDAVSQLCRNLCHFHCLLSSTHGYATTSGLTCSVLAV